MLRKKNVAPTEAGVLKKAAESQLRCPSLMIYLCPLGVNICGSGEILLSLTLF